MSRSRSSSRKGSAKAKKKTPKQQIKELTEMNTQLTAELDLIRANQALLSDKLIDVTNRIVSGINIKEYGLNNETEVLNIETHMILDMVSSLIVKKRTYETSVEARTEQLENRVTRMNMENAKMTRKTTAYECGLREIIQCQDIEQARDRAYQLHLLAGLYLFA